MDVRTREADFRDVMRRFPTGVTVVTTSAPSGRPVGLTVSSFTSVSLDPPLVLACVDRGSDTHHHLVRAGGFAVSVLAAGQEDVALRFAAEPSEGRFDEIAWHVGASGHPLISGASGWLDCVIHEILPGGDHSIFLGRVVDSGLGDVSSMLYHGGSFGAAGP